MISAVLVPIVAVVTKAPPGELSFNTPSGLGRSHGGVWGAPLPRCTRARFQGARAVCVQGARATSGTCAGPSVLVP